MMDLFGISPLQAIGAAVAAAAYAAFIYALLVYHDVTEDDHE